MAPGLHISVGQGGRCLLGLTTGNCSDIGELLGMNSCSCVGVKDLGVFYFGRFLDHMHEDEMIAQLDGFRGEQDGRRGPWGK